MGFHADLHVHSKHSRATSEDCDLEHLSAWARRKGVTVLGTGDFTHPGWLRELEEKLVPAEPGLFRLRPEIERAIEAAEEGLPGSPTRFVLQVEISTIYKKGDRTRKVHHLVYAPDLEKARAFAASLARIGNIASDGRPILGLDSRDLLEIALSSGEGCHLIPAHIWTPWFAALGSKSGFDRLEECYGDLSGHVFAVETGLSSDPPMNRRLSGLDRYSLISSSDAHSPPKIGREACSFETDLDYSSIFRALRTGEGHGGTVELFAEEGKYHLDGHRKCGVCLSPEETRRNSGLCPACGKELTLGVLHRVHELADRDEEEGLGAAAGKFRSFVPLAEILAEVEGVGPQSKAVARLHDRMLRRLGPELDILERAPVEDVRRAASEPVAEALVRMRSGRVIRRAGYDGEYGTIRLFEEGELSRRGSGGVLLDILDAAAPRPRAVAEAEPRARSEEAGGPPSAAARTSRASAPTSSAVPAPARPTVAPERASAPAPAPARVPVPADARDDLLAALDPEQRAAAEIVRGPLRIVAGPGTGKTRTLTRRIAHLVRGGTAAPEECLAVTFTRRAAAELRERLEGLLGPDGLRVPVHTFHSLGLEILREHGRLAGLTGGTSTSAPRIAGETERARLLSEALGVPVRKARALLDAISRAKRDGRPPEGPAAREALETHERILREKGLVDLDDLIVLPVRLLEARPDVAGELRRRRPWVSVDEFQDVDALQYRLVRLLAPAGGDVCVIGDPDQSIYGFRGADPEFFERFAEDFPGTRTIRLARSYRSSGTIVEASLGVIARESLVPGRRLEAVAGGAERIEIHECASEKAEAELVVHSIERAIGGSGFFSLDTGRVESHEGQALAFGDFAVLYRTKAQAEPLIEAFRRSGIPFQARSHAALAELPEVRAVLDRLAALSDGVLGSRPVADLLGEAASGLGSERPELSEHLPRLAAIASRHGTDAAGFLSEVELGIDADLWDPRAEAVSLLTLHASKGLEFPVVFIVGCEDGIVPLRLEGGRDDPAEERRLLFVGMTRARSRLVLSRARKRLWRGSVRAAEPSPFLEEIRDELLDRRRQEAVRREAAPYRQLSLFEEA